METTLNVQAETCEASKSALSVTALTANVVQFAANNGVSAAASDVSVTILSCMLAMEGSRTVVNMVLVVAVNRLTGDDVNAVSTFRFLRYCV
jgi:hypothetical protein